MKQKHILTIKIFIILITMIVIPYLLLGKIGVIGGLCGAFIIVTMLDKDLSENIFKEFFKIFLLQLFIIFVTIFSNINYVTLIIGTFVVALIITNTSLYYKKTPRSLGFLYLYTFIIYLKVPVSQYPKLVLSILLSSVLVILIYFILTRKLYFTHSKTTAKETLTDVEIAIFKQFKIKYSLISAILFSLSIFVMQYFYKYHGLWLVITVMVVMIPDRKLTFNKALHRILGTIIGSIIFIVISTLIAGNHEIIISSILCLIAIYCSLYPMKYYSIQASCTTFFALTIDSFFYKGQSHEFLSFYRILFTLIGAALILLFVYAYPKIDALFKTKEKLAN